MIDSDRGQYCRVPIVNNREYNQSAWTAAILQKWVPTNWNGHQHQRLQAQDSPCMSTCTTATNLSSLGDFQSNTTIYTAKRMQENLKMTIPEIEPLQKKSEEDVEKQEPEKEKLTLGKIRNQLLTAIVVSWVSMIIGYCSAYTSPATISMKKDLDLDDTQVTWITSLMPLGALIGAACGGFLIENIGRKWTILLTDLLFLLAFLLNYFAQNYIYMYVSRLTAGISVGTLSLTLPVYLAETIQPEVRGTLGLLPTAFGNIGILVCYLFGTFCNWQKLALVGVIISIPFVIVVWVIKETPRYLMSAKKEDETRNALQWLRGSANIDKEYHELKKAQDESDEQALTICVLFKRSYLKPIGITLVLMALQQFSGINAVIFYSTNIFKQTGAKLDEFVSTTIIGAVNFISTFIAAFLVDRLGRKILLYISSVSMVISLAVLGTYFYLKDVGGYDLSSVELLPLISFIVYIVGFSLGFGPVPWLMMGEILPAKIRGPAASVVTAFNWTCTFIVTNLFMILGKAIGFHFVFWIFGAIVLSGIQFIYVFAPETRGQSLDDIERKLAGKKVRRMSSLANMKPMPSSF